MLNDRRFTALEVASLFFLVVIALSIRLMGIEERCLWSDEVVAVGYNAGPLGDSLARIVAEDIHPPLYYLLQRIVLGFLVVDGALGLRILSLAAGFAACLVAFLAGRELFGFRAGLAAGLFLALQPEHILQSQTARMYALSVLAMLLAVEAFRRVERGEPRSGRLLAAIIAFGLWLDYPLLLGFAALALPRLLAGGRRRAILGAFAFALATLIPLAAWNLAARLGPHPAAAKFLATEFAPAPLSELAAAYLRFTVPTDLAPLAPLTLALLLPVFLPLARDRAEASSARAVLAAAALPPFLLWIVSGLLGAAGGPAVFVPRAVAFTLGPVALWIGFLASRPRSARLYGFLLAGMSAALLFQHQVLNVEYLDRGWREVAAYMGKHAGAANRFYAAPWFLDDELRFYRDGRTEPLPFEPAAVGVASYPDIFRRHAAPRASVEASLERATAGLDRLFFVYKDLECGLGDGRMLDHDRVAIDWFRARWHLQGRMAWAFPNGRGRREVFLFGREPVPIPRERSATFALDPTGLPILSRFALNPVATLHADRDLAYAFKTDAFEVGPDGRLEAYAFLPEGSFETLVARAGLDPVRPLAANATLSALLVGLDAFAREFLGADLLDLGTTLPSPGGDPRKIHALRLKPDPSADPFLRLLAFLLGGGALVAGLLALGAGLLARGGAARRAFG